MKVDDQEERLIAALQLVLEEFESTARPRAR